MRTILIAVVATLGILPPGPSGPALGQRTSIGPPSSNLSGNPNSKPSPGIAGNSMIPSRSGQPNLRPPFNKYQMFLPEGTPARSTVRLKKKQ
jgi:hypothetical protein